MYRKFLLTASAMCVASVAMLLCPDPAFAQREGKGGKGGGGGGRSGGGNVSRGNSAPANRGNSGRSNASEAPRVQSNRTESPSVSRPRETSVPRVQPNRTESAPTVAAPGVPNQEDVRRNDARRDDIRREDVRRNEADRTTVNKPVITNDAGKAGVVTPRNTDRNRPPEVSRPERDPNRDTNRRDDWTNWNRNRSTTDWDRNNWDRNRGDWSRNDWDRNRGNWSGNDWNRNWNNWNNWNRNFASRNWGSYSTPGYWNNYYRSGYLGSPFFGYGGGYPGYGYGGYGLGGWLPGIGIGLGIGRLFGGGYGGGYYGGGYGYPGNYAGNYYSGYSTTTTPDTVVTEAEPAVTGDYLETARAAFQSGDYARAQRLANHAVIDTPDNAKAHELMSLAFFAQGNYAGAAEAAHAAVSLGDTIPDWPTLYSYYNDRSKYEQHFNALKQFIGEHPNAPEGRFLLGLHHLMMGHQDPARNEIAQYLKLVDHQDPIGVKLYGAAGGDVNALPKPTTPAPIPAAPDIDRSSE